MWPGLIKIGVGSSIATSVSKVLYHMPGSQLGALLVTRGGSHEELAMGQLESRTKWKLPGVFASAYHSV